MGWDSLQATAEQNIEGLTDMPEKVEIHDDS